MERDQLIYLEHNIINSRHKIYKASSVYFDSMYIGNADSHELEFSKDLTWERLKELYFSICLYFELNNLLNYLQDFKKKFGSIIENREKSISFTHYRLADGDWNEDIGLLAEWDTYLRPFKFYSDNKTSEFKRLSELLRCTNQILKLAKVAPIKEDDINRVIREVLSLYYYNVVAFSEGYFRHRFSSYRPDIIVRDIGASIEYKLIRDNTQIRHKMDELLVDAKRYTGNSDNQLCIAVFCLCTPVTVPEKNIIQDWNELNFPLNWELIIIHDVRLGENL